MIRKLLVATFNQGKSREITTYLHGLPIQVASLQELPPAEPFEETGHTFMENARGKSLYYSQFWDDLTLGEDSGLEIDALDGAPGVYSARFSGPQANDTKNIKKVLKLMQHVPMERRKAGFVSCMVLSHRNQVIQEIKAEVRGFVAEKAQGQGGFGYDPIFFYPALNKTFAELLPEEKNQVSHRGKALHQLIQFLHSYLS